MMIRRLISLLAALVLLLSAASVYAEESSPELTLTLSEETLTVVRGKAGKLTAVLSDPSVKARLSWESSDSSVAAVSGGSVTGKKAGTAVVTCRAVLKDGRTAEASCAVTVVERVKSVKVGDYEKTMTEGDLQRVPLVVSPETATDPGMDWTTSDSSVVTVSSDGILTAVGEGRATVTVQARDGSKVKTSFQVNVIRRIRPVKIVTLSNGVEHVIGLRPDGTVLADGDNEYHQCDVSGWTDIVSVCAGGYFSLGLKANGTVVSTQGKLNRNIDVRGWTRVVALAAGCEHAVALLDDGTCVASGSGEFGQCNVSGWTDIVDIACGSWHTLGLKADGTVVCCGYNKYGQLNLSEWKNIVALDGSDWCSFGLTEDGRVLAAGGWDDGDVRLLKGLAEWSDIESIYCDGADCVVGIRRDGTALLLGSDKTESNVAAKVRVNWNHGTVTLFRDGTTDSFLHFEAFSGATLKLPVSRVPTTETHRADQSEMGIWQILTYTNAVPGARDSAYLVNGTMFDGTGSSQSGSDVPFGVHIFIEKSHLNGNEIFEHVGFRLLENRTERMTWREKDSRMFDITMKDSRGASRTFSGQFYGRQGHSHPGAEAGAGAGVHAPGKGHP